MYYIGLNVHKKTISYCVKDVKGRVYHEGKIGATRRDLDEWMKTLPQPWSVAMEATIFTGWIYDHLLHGSRRLGHNRPNRHAMPSVRVVGITGQSLLVCPLVVELVYGGRRYSLIAFRRSDYKAYSKWLLQLALAVITGRI